MRITHMRLNHLTEPVGYRLDGLRFSWVAEDARGKKQQSAQIIVARDEAFTKTVYDSGRVENADSAAFEADIKVEPVTRYYWRVGVWSDLGEYAEGFSFFETAKLDEPWRFPWIAADMDKDIHPILKKDFTLSGDIKQARAYVAGLGIFELEINGQKAGDEYLLPGFHSYDRWVQYTTFDLTGLLRGGGNTVTARLGNGWYKGRLVLDFTRGMTTDIYGDRMCFRCEIRVDYADGRVEYIGTDESWRARPSETTFSGIYDGEHIDARIDEDSASGWGQAVLYEPENTGPLSARLSPPIRMVERCKPVLITTPKNETVLDFGQIMTGWAEFETNAPEGTEIFLQYGEILQDGCFYNENLRSAKAEFKYLSDGKRRVVRPRFTFYGFRYVKVTGINPNPADFTGCVIMSALERYGTLQTAHEGVNQLIENIVWGQKGNFLDVPTDCPQRDERLGWTGDAQIFCGTGCFNLYAALFYHKYLTDMRHEQLIYQGAIPFVVPNPKKADDDPAKAGQASAAWADAAAVIPWDLYLHYGDRALLAQHYPLMKDFVDYMYRQDEAGGGKRLYQTGFHFADWLALDNFLEPDSAMGGTDMYYIASAYYAYSTGLAAKAARILGYTEDAETYARRAEEIKQAIRREYFTETGRPAIDTQTASVVALFMDLIPEDLKSRAADHLLTRLQKRKMHLETGFVGTPYLMRVLSACGMSDAAYTLLFNDDYPSWLYEVKMGATTVWERWNSVLSDGKISGTGMNSLNHYAYGSVGEWLYRDVCGLNPTEGAPGFLQTVIAPKPDPRLPWAKLSQMTARGLYEIAWEYKNESAWVLTLTVPFNCEAAVRIPVGLTAREVVEHGTDGTTGARVNAEAEALTTGVLTLPAGRYEIRCVL